MSFTPNQLEEALLKLKTADRDFPEHPLRIEMDSDYRLWDESSYPLTLTQVGDEKGVRVYCEDYFGGEEGGDHRMYIILRTGNTYNGTARYFEKTGEYNSWDDSYWDGAIQEVEAKEVTKTEWVTKA